MKALEFGLNIPVVVTFLSKKSEPYQKQTQWGEKTYHNYTVRVDKVNGNKIGERRVLVATDYLESFLMAKNAGPGSCAKITMIEKGNGHTGWEVEVADKLVDVQEEEPAEPDQPKAKMYTDLMLYCYEQLMPMIQEVADKNQVSIETFITSINTVYMSCTKAGVFE